SHVLRHVAGKSPRYTRHPQRRKINMNQTYNWQFPLPRTHAGMLMGNGVLGAMVWGGDNVLKVTLGRADWWDHRSGKRWTPEMNYSNLRRLLEANDEPAIRKIFA